MGIVRNVEMGDARIVPPAPRDVPPDDPGMMLAEARQRAEQEGFAAGEAAARAEYGPPLARALAALESALVGVEEYRRALEARAADEAADLAVLIAARIIGREVATDPAHVQEMITAAMRSADDRPVRVIVHPDDAAVAASITGSWVGGPIEVAESHDVEPGGCRIETPSGDLDARIPVRLERIRAALADAAPRD